MASRNSPPPVIDYAAPARQRASWVVAGAIVAAIGFAFGTLLILMPDLHNDRPFFWIWLIAAIFCTPPIWLAFWRSTGRDRAGAIVARSVLVIWLFCAGLSAMSIYTWIAHEDPHVTGRNRSYCHLHLRSLGMALMFYRADHAGRYPISLAELATAPNEFVQPADFICPGVHPNGYHARPTTQEVVALYSGNATPPFVYRAAGLRGEPDPAAVLIHDQLANHSHDSGPADVHFLYGDGDVKTLNRRQAAKVIAELDAGHNPPRAEMLK